MISADLQKKLQRIVELVNQSNQLDALDRVEQLCFLIILKYLDEATAEKKSAHILESSTQRSQPIYLHQANRFRWSKWKTMCGDALWSYVNHHVFPYMASVDNYDLTIADFFRDTELKLGSPALLEALIKEIDQFDIHSLDPKIRGDLFESLLNQLVRNNQKTKPFKDKIVRQLMIQMASPSIGDKILDPVCGLGGFLVDVMGYLCTRPRKETNKVVTKEANTDEKLLQNTNMLHDSIYGFTASRQLLRISTTNLLMHGMENAHLLLNEEFIFSNLDSETNDVESTFDVIVSFPFPYFGHGKNRMDKHRYFSASRKSETSFLIQAMRHLAPGGRCVLLYPRSWLAGFRIDRHGLRKSLVDNFELLAIVEISESVSILMFRKPIQSHLKRQTNKVWFYEFPINDCRFNAQQPADNMANIGDFIAKWDEYSNSHFYSPPGQEAGTVLEPGSCEPRCWWVDSDTLAANAYSIDAREYKPLVAKAVPNENPADLIRCVLKNEREVIARIENLFQDLNDSQ